MHNTRLADTGVVSQGNATLCNLTNKTGSRENPSDAPRLANSTASAAQVLHITRVPLIREQLNKIGLSLDTIGVLMAFWRKTTGKQHNSYLSRWALYFHTKHINMNQVTVYDGMEFLTSLYQQGLGYRTINSAHSALSAAINQEDKTTFRDHSLVTHFLKGIFELKPSLPRYTVIWDVGTVLQIL